MSHRFRAVLATALLPPALLLAACGDGAPDASGASASEASQLNDAAAMLDANSVSSAALGDNIGDATAAADASNAAR